MDMDTRWCFVRTFSSHGSGLVCVHCQDVLSVDKSKSFHQVVFMRIRYFPVLLHETIITGCQFDLSSGKLKLQVTATSSAGKTHPFN